MQYPVESKTLDELITITINLDDKLRHRALEKKYRFGPPIYGEAYDFLPRLRETYDRDDHKGLANQRQPRGLPRTHAQVNAEGYYRPMLMELNALKRSDHTGQRNGKYSKRSSCYSYSKTGHIARNCQQGKQNSCENINKAYRRINMIKIYESATPSDNEEWEVIEIPSPDKQDDEKQGFNNVQDAQAIPE